MNIPPANRDQLKGSAWTIAALLLSLAGYNASALKEQFCGCKPVPGPVVPLPEPEPTPIPEPETKPKPKPAPQPKPKPAPEPKPKPAKSTRAELCEQLAKSIDAGHIDTTDELVRVLQIMSDNGEWTKADSAAVDAVLPDIADAKRALTKDDAKKLRSVK